MANFELWHSCRKWEICRHKFVLVILSLVIIENFSLPTDAHNVKKHRVIKTF